MAISRIARSLTALSVLTLGFAYALFAREFIGSFDGAITTYGLWDVVLDTAFSAQFLAFVIVPAWLIRCIIRTRSLSALPYQLRTGNRRNVFTHELNRSFENVSVVAIGLMTLWFAASVGLALQSTPRPGSAAEIFAENELPPVVALLIQFAVVTVWLLGAQALIIGSYSFSNSDVLSVILATLMWVWVVASASSFASGTLASAGFYLDSANMIDRVELGALGLALSLSTSIGVYAAFRFFDRMQRRRIA